MKNSKWGSIVAKALSIALLTMGYSFATMKCEGTVYFKLPDGWNTAATAAGGLPTVMKESTEYPGWLVVTTDAIGQMNEAKDFYIEENGKNDCQSGHCATKRSINKISQQPSMESFNCSDFGKEGELWIMAHPDPEKENAVLITTTKPVIKNFYVFTPSSQEWMRSLPMITNDGGKTSEALKIASEDRCGWYIKRFINEELPSNVLIFRDDDPNLDDAIGFNGDWETANDPKPIDLAMMFDAMGTDDLYFVMTEEYADITMSETMGWLTEDPIEVSANCSYNLAAIIYDTDASLHPLFSCSAGPSNSNACPDNALSQQYDQAVQNCVGVHTGIVEETLGADKKPHLSNSANAQACFPSEELFNQMFNSTKGVNEMSCFDMPFSRASDGKWEFNSDYFTSPGAPVPGGFYPAEETTDAIVLAAFPNQTPVADARKKRKAEGPVPMVPEARAINAKEGARVMDLVCNGPGWNGGGKCEGLYATGGDLNTLFGIAKDPWLWGGAPTDFPNEWNFFKSGTETIKDSARQNPRWTSDPGVKDPASGDYPQGYTQKGRNQHFCFESHAKFTYKPGLKFSFSGDDDIWVFIDNKLAVDLGGTHLAAPGYVDVDTFKGQSGGWVDGQRYDIDIFFCDRRTTMSNIRVKTNMYIQQNSGLSKQIVSKKSGAESYKLVYTKTSAGDCGSVTSDDEGEKTYTGDELCSYLTSVGKTLEYSIIQKNGKEVLSKEQMAESKVYYDGIDLTNRCDPKIDKSKIAGLSANTYFLIASAEGKTEKFQFKVTGSLDVATKPGQAQDEDGNTLPGLYEYTSLALASTGDNVTRIPLYISALMDEGDKLLFDISSAVDQTYTLSVLDAAGAATSNLTLEYRNENGEYVTLNPSTLRTIGAGGVDTVYASVPMGLMTQSEQVFNVSVSGGHATAKLTFFMPKLVFVENETATTPLVGDPESEERWTGSVYNFYLLALAPSVSTPGAYEPCGDRCNFNLLAGSLTSPGLVVDTMGMQVVNGRAMISVYSQKEYRNASGGDAANPATLSITGPSSLIKADYSPLYFRNPPVPFPVFADIFDVHGKKPSVQMVIDQPYFSMDQEYLDGIADSLVVYYNRPFYNSTDSLPNRIVVLWDGDGEKDSVIVPKEQFGPMACGPSVGLDDTLCLPRIIISGVEFSKDVRTANPSGIVLSYATFVDRGHKVEDKFPGNINDRIAPIIKQASVYALDDKWNKMTIELSEEVKVPNNEYTQKAFTVFLNSATNLSGSDKFIVAIESPSPLAVAGDKVTIQFPASSDNGLSPHTGDYIRFRADTPVWVDASVTVTGTDESMRPADDAMYSWNAPTDYNSTGRLPSPWAPVTGEAETGVKSINYVEITSDTILPTITTVKGYPITDDFATVEADNPGVLGYFLQSDMYSIIYSDSSISNYLTDPANVNELNNVYLEFELDVFTNLGAFVAHESKKILCTDATIFGEGHNCLDTQRNIFISWNTVSNKGRLVGTGVFVSKMKSAVHLGKKGTRAKMDKTRIWGVRRGKGVVNQ